MSTKKTTKKVTAKASKKAVKKATENVKTEPVAADQVDTQKQEPADNATAHAFEAGYKAGMTDGRAEGYEQADKNHDDSCPLAQTIQLNQELSIVVNNIASLEKELNRLNRKRQQLCQQRDAYADLTRAAMFQTCG